MTTNNIEMNRGQTLSITMRARNSQGYLNLTGAKVFVHVRADMKVDPQIKLASEATADHRVGIEIDADQDSGRGRFVITFVPEDTESLVAMGADDPYFYDVWVRLGDGSQFPVISTSRLDLYPQVTTVPA